MHQSIRQTTNLPKFIMFFKVIVQIMELFNPIESSSGISRPMIIHCDYRQNQRLRFSLPPPPPFFCGGGGGLFAGGEALHSKDVILERAPLQVCKKFVGQKIILTRI